MSGTPPFPTPQSWLQALHMPGIDRTLTKRSRREEAGRSGRPVHRHLSRRSGVASRSELVAGFPSRLTRPRARRAAPPAVNRRRGLKPDAPPRQRGNLTPHASAVYSLSCYATGLRYWSHQPTKTLILDHVDLGSTQRDIVFLTIRSAVCGPAAPGVA